MIILRGRRASPTLTFTHESHVIAANHRSGLDPFAIVSSLRIRDFFRLAPFSFMTANRFMKPLWLRPLAWAAGCFPSHPGLGAHGIQKALDDLEHDYTLVIFPEGKRSKDNETQAKRGIGTIMQGSPRSRLILVHIEWKATASVESIHMSYPPKNSLPIPPEDIMQAIYKL